MALSEAERIRRAKPGMHCFGNQLYLQVTPSTVDSKRLIKSWIFRFACTEQERAAGRGRERQMGLGSLETLAHQRRAWLRRQADYRIKQGLKPLDELKLLAKIEQLSLDAARELAAEARKQREEGFDPIEKRNAEREAARAQAKLGSAKILTFDECAARYITDFEKKWKNPKHRGQWATTLRTYVSPYFGNLSVNLVDTEHVEAALRPIWHTKPETASRVRGRIEAILAWARIKKLRKDADGNDLENPARWHNHLDKLFPSKAELRGEGEPPHHEALPYQEIAEFMAELRARASVPARALEFIILTATRSGEALGARWDEIDQARVWTVPAARMKARREHQVPLSDAAVALLSGMARDGERIFSITNMAIHHLIARMGRSDLTVHGFRSTFRDWAAECTDYPNELLELTLAHKVSDKVEAAYRRGTMFDKRRGVMAEWAAYCAGPDEEKREEERRRAAKPAPAGEVVQLPLRQA